MSRQNILSVVLVVLFLAISLVWVSYYDIGFGSFDKQNAIVVFSSAIQGMSALLSVAIALVIFRIQSLENRNQSLEQSTLNYIHQIIGWSYPAWTSSTEEHIRSKSITDRYCLMIRTRRLGQASPISNEEEKSILEERDRQQKRLEETLNRHNKTAKTIQRMKSGFIPTAIFLIAPILFSLLMLMVSDALDSFWNFVFVSLVVLMSALGIILLIKVVLESIVEI